MKPCELYSETELNFDDSFPWEDAVALQKYDTAFKSGKAMKSSPLLGPFCCSKFWGFSLLIISMGSAFLCFKLETIVSSALIHSTILSSQLLSED